METDHQITVDEAIDEIGEEIVSTESTEPNEDSRTSVRYYDDQGRTLAQRIRETLREADRPLSRVEVEKILGERIISGTFGSVVNREDAIVRVGHGRYRWVRRYENDSESHELGVFESEDTFGFKDGAALEVVEAFGPKLLVRDENADLWMMKVERSITT